MSLFVQKYGGTSVGSIERIKAVADKVIGFRQQGHDIVVVVSAMSGETNRLIGLAEQIQDQIDPREYDVLVSTGEQVTIALLCMALKAAGCDARSYTGGQVRILTDSKHSKARIQEIDDSKIRADLALGRVVVVAGFQGVDAEGNITTLGRGGSDTSAVAIAAALGADECQIYTDVDGVYTTDPRVVENARRLDRITFEEMLEMASQGSKVLQIRSVEFAGKYQVPLRVLSSFEEGQGTLISLEDSNQMENPIVSGIAFNRDEAKITLKGVPDRPGSASDILGIVAESNIEVDVIVQNVGYQGSSDFSFTVHRNDVRKTMDLLLSAQERLGVNEIISDEGIAKLALVGVGMRSHAGVAALMFKVLGDEGINIQMISTSEIKITVIIEEKYLELAVRSIHSAFQMDRKPEDQSVL